jgi:hypothetical protein
MAVPIVIIPGYHTIWQDWQGINQMSIGREFDAQEIDLLRRMLRHDSIDFPIVDVRGIPRNRDDAMITIQLMRNLFDKGAIDHPEESPMHIRLTTKIATMADVVCERTTINAPFRWIPRNQAIRIRMRREGQRIGKRIYNECRLTKGYKNHFSLEKFADHRNEYVSPNDSDVPLQLIGTSRLWKSDEKRVCDVCNNHPNENEYCLSCDRIGGFTIINRKRR